MSTQELRRCLGSVGVIICATASACATSDASDPAVSILEQFRKHAEGVDDGHKINVVELDTALTLEQLRDYHDKNVAHSNIGVTNQASTVNVASGHDDMWTNTSSADFNNCPGTFVYHFSGYGGSQQYSNTFHGFSQDTHHIGTVADDAECLGYGIGSINAIYDENNILVNGEYRLCCNNDCGPSISRVSFTLDDTSCGSCPGTFVYHFSGYGDTQQYDITFRGLSSDSHHIETVANDDECLSYGIGSINAVYDQDDHLVNGEYRLCCNNSCGPSITRVSFSADDPECMQ